MAKDEPREYRRRESGFASGLFWGVALGAAGMFLFATKKGEKLKDYLKEHGQKILEDFEEIYEETEGIKRPTKELSKPKKKELSAEKENKSKKQDLGHIEKLQERGRKAAGRFFTRKGKTLK